MSEQKELKHVCGCVGNSRNEDFAWIIAQEVQPGVSAGGGQFCPTCRFFSWKFDTIELQEEFLDRMQNQDKEYSVEEVFEILAKGNAIRREKGEWEDGATTH